KQGLNLTGALSPEDHTPGDRPQSIGAVRMALDSCAITGVERHPNSPNGLWPIAGSMIFRTVCARQIQPLLGWLPPGDVCWTKSHRLPYRSSKTATVPYDSTRGSSTKRTPRARIARWSCQKSLVCKKRNTRPPVWSPTRATWARVDARARSNVTSLDPGGAMRTHRLPSVSAVFSTKVKPRL